MIVLPGTTDKILLPPRSTILHYWLLGKEGMILIGI